MLNIRFFARKHFSPFQYAQKQHVQNFFGSRQHGLPLLKVASLQMDLETLQDAQQAAAAVIQTADSLNAPELAPLKARVEALFTRQEVSLN